MSCQGIVKSFSQKNGYGFVSYNEQDIFVHQRDCQDCVPQVGDTVSFELEESPSKPGSYKASNVTGGTGVLEAQFDVSKSKGKGKPPAAGTGAYYGSVKSFNDTKAWGFIVYEGTDVFFHLKDMVDGSSPRVGDQVQLDLEENPAKPGSMKAKNVTGGTGYPQQKGKDGGKGKDKGYGMYDGGKGGWGMDPWSGGGGAWGPYGGGMDKGWGKGDGGWGKGDGGWGKGDPWGKGGGMDWSGGWGCKGGKDGGKMAKGGW